MRCGKGPRPISAGTPVHAMNVLRNRPLRAPRGGKARAYTLQTHTMSKHRPPAVPRSWFVWLARTHEPGLATRRVITGTHRDRFHAWWKSTFATSCSGRRTHTMHRGGQHTHERIWSTPLTYRYTMNEDSARRAQATRRGTERTSSCTASSQLRLRVSTAKTRRGDNNRR